MCLDDFQKDLVRCLNKEGPDGIRNMIMDLILENEIVFTKRQYNSSPRGTGVHVNSYFVEFFAKNVSAFRNIPKICDPLSEYANKTTEDLVPDPNIYEVLKEQEIKLKRIFLFDLQRKIEASLHLIQRLTECDLIITYAEDLPGGYKIGHLKQQENKEVLSFEIIKETYGNQNRLYESINSFFCVRLILLPGLIEFENNKFLTIQEIDRRLEMKQLKKQTRYVLIGILVSAIITLIPMLRECHLAGHERIEIEYPGELLILQTDEKQFQVGAN